MNFEEKYNELVEKIRWTKDQYINGDDKCWKDLEDLFKLLPEGYTPPERDECVELQYCQWYIKSCHNPNIKYESPQRRIEELEKEVEELQRIRVELENDVFHYKELLWRYKEC